MTEETPLPPLEREPAWLVAAVDQRLAFMKEATGGTLSFIEAARLQGLKVIMSFLTEPEGESKAHFEHWSKTCDNCGKFQYFDTIPGCVERNVGDIKLVFAFGMCQACKDLP